MHLLPLFLGLLHSLSIRGRRRWLLHRALLAGGIALLLLSSASPLAGERDGATASAAPLRAELLGLSPGARPHSESEPTLDVGPALARVDARALYDGLVRLAVALEPAPPADQPKEPAAPPTPPAAPPQQIAAPQAEPETTSEAATPMPQPPAPSCPSASMSGFALAVFNAINDERTQRGLPALAAHGCVVYVARLRSEDMASRDYFSHSSPDGETAFSLMDRYGVPYGWAGENLASNNYPDEESVGGAIRDLMASEGHRANILSENYTRLGVGAAANGSGMKYFTMIFVG